MGLSCALLFTLITGPNCCGAFPGEQDEIFNQARENGLLANEGLRRSQNYVRGWLRHADPDSGLIPRTLDWKIYSRKPRKGGRDIWNAKDAAADNYPFMVLTCALTDLDMFNGRMLDMLNTEIKLTSRIDRLPDTYNFVTKRFQNQIPDLEAIIFGSSEYIKDGLLPLTEWLGPSPWSERMIGILDDLWKHAQVQTPYGNIVSTNVEVNGEMLQALSRIYWMTGEKKYLDWALRLGDYYLLDQHHPTRDMDYLRLRDHGCEIVSGLCELYAAVNFALPEKKLEYEKPIHQMLDRILEVGRNEHGLFYDVINPVAGTVLNDRVADTWGYTYNGYYTVYLIDKTEAYRTATIKALSSLNDHYRNYDWETGSADGYADSIESALNLYNREPVASAADWIDSEIKVMWAMQKEDGVIEGWHGDGNFARTTIMYCLWKTGGVTIQPWREDVIMGAVMEEEELWLSIEAQEDWSGKIIFDVPRHKTIMNLPLDWPRINQFPEWFTVEPDKTYRLKDNATNTEHLFTGQQLQNGIDLILESGRQKRIHVMF